MVDVEFRIQQFRHLSRRPAHSCGSFLQHLSGRRSGPAVFNHHANLLNKVGEKYWRVQARPESPCTTCHARPKPCPLGSATNRSEFDGEEIRIGIAEARPRLAQPRE